jgi:hypothetical protein
VRVLVSAQYYRDKLKAEVEGREWKAPKRSSKPPPGSSKSRSSSGIHKAKSGTAVATDEWGWDDDHGGGGGGVGMTRASSLGAMSKSGGGGGGGGHARSSSTEYSQEDYMRSAAQKEEFFARQMERNQSKPTGIPPSQGGKYVGFGSVGSAPPAPANDNPLGALIGGFGKLTAAASSAAQQATARVQNGEVGARLAQGTSTGLSWLKGAVSSVDNLLSNAVNEVVKDEDDDGPLTLYNPEARQQRGEKSSSKFVGFEGGVDNSGFGAGGAKRNSGFGSGGGGGGGGGGAYGSSSSSYQGGGEDFGGVGGGGASGRGMGRTGSSSSFSGSAGGMGSKSASTNKLTHSGSANSFQGWGDEGEEVKGGKGAKGKDGWGDDWVDDDWGR